MRSAQKSPEKKHVVAAVLIIICMRLQSSLRFVRLIQRRNDFKQFQSNVILFPQMSEWAELCFLRLLECFFPGPSQASLSLLKVKMLHWVLIETQ